MNLLSLYLNRPLSTSMLEYALDITMSRGIENGYYGRNDALHVVLAPFGVLTLIAEEKKTLLDALAVHAVLDHHRLEGRAGPVVDGAIAARFQVGIIAAVPGPALAAGGNRGRRPPEVERTFDRHRAGTGPRQPLPDG